MADKSLNCSRKFFFFLTKVLVLMLEQNCIRVSQINLTSLLEQILGHASDWPKGNARWTGSCPQKFPCGKCRIDLSAKKSFIPNVERHVSFFGGSELNNSCYLTFKSGCGGAIGLSILLVYLKFIPILFDGLFKFTFCYFRVLTPIQQWNHHHQWQVLLPNLIKWIVF